MTIRNTIRFLLNDQEVELGDVAPSDTLLDHLRLRARLMGTKEGCAEGDCGACTVLVGSLRDESLRYEPVNACIRFLASLDRCHVVTIEHLAPPGGPLHPVQTAMVEEHGSQCGFCTPGIVMALWALWARRPEPDDEEIETALQGSLCRCTGYAPILRAAKKAARIGHPDADRLVARTAETAARLSNLAPAERVETSRNGARAILPASVDDLADAFLKEPTATLIAGATDVGLWVTKEMRSIAPAIFVGHLDALKGIETTADEIVIGAGVSYADFETLIERELPHLSAFWRRIGGPQVRAMGTVGGNIANGSPIGDTPPVLIALGARLGLRRGSTHREIMLEDYFLDYGQQNREPGEFVERIVVPRPPQGSLNAAYKISKRRDEDISGLAAGFRVIRDPAGKITMARLAFGGMAAAPKRASGAEAALLGRTWDAKAVAAAQAALLDDFAPITDWRATAEYRMLAARNLLRRFFLETSDQTSPVQLSREVA